MSVYNKWGHEFNAALENHPDYLMFNTERILGNSINYLNLYFECIFDFLDDHPEYRDSVLKFIGDILVFAPTQEDYVKWGQRFAKSKIKYGK